MRVLLAAAMLVNLLVLPVAAQSAEAPHLDPVDHILYLHTETGQDMWMNALPVDGAGSNICYTEPTPSQLGDLCPNPGEDFSFVFELMPGLAHDLVLDTAGSIDVEIYWGGACCTVGTADYELTLSSGDATIATTSGQHRMNPGAVSSVCPNEGCVYNAIRESITPDIATVLASDGLTLTIEGSGTWSHAAISTTDTRGVSSISLPILATVGGAPELVFVDTELPIDQTFENATTSVVQYNWTGGGPLHLEADVQAGNLSLWLDAQNETAFSWNGTSLDEVLSDACTGLDNCTYALRVDMQDFVGSFSVSVVEEAEEEVPEVSDDDVPPGDGNETLDDASADKDTPLPAVVPAAALGLAALMRRRR